MCQYPAHKVNVSRKGVLCTPDYSKFFETPSITETVLMVVRHDNAVDTHLHFAYIKHFCLLKMKNDIGCNSGSGHNC